MRLGGGRGILGCALATAIACVAPSSASALTTIGYPDFSSVAGLQLNGSALRSNDGRLELTSSEVNQRASAFSTTRIDPRQSFATSFELSMTDGGNQPADGMAFVLQSAGPTALTASGLGASLGYEGIVPSVAVEFDIFNGDPGDPGYVPSGAFDPADQHVAITRGGDPTRHLACATVRTPPDPPCTASLAGPLYGAPVFAWVDYSSASHQLSVSVAPAATKPAHPTLATTIDLGSALGASTFAGFTAATGQTFALQRLFNWRLISGFGPPVVPDADHDGVPDASDHCPARAAGRYDHDHDGCPGPYSRMKDVQPNRSFLIVPGGVRLTDLFVTYVPHGATVLVRCPSCHITERRRAPGTKGTKTVHLKKIMNHTIRSGHSFTVTVTAPGYIGVVFRATAVRHGSSARAFRRAGLKPFHSIKRCLPPGGKKPALHCSASPA